MNFEQHPSVIRYRERVGTGLRPRTIAGFLVAMPLIFQRGRAAEMDHTTHLEFHGEEQRQATVVIREGTLEVTDGLQGEPDLTVRADSRTWLQFLGKERGVFGALVTGKVRVKGPPSLLKAFAACFPG